MKKVLVVFGTRPEAIKMAPLVLALRIDSAHFNCITCVTAQHRQMLDQVLELFSIDPDFDLNVMKPGQDLIDVTQSVLTGMRDVLSQSKPDIVLVQGDTTTTMTAALAAFYERIPVGHVEAGLRTHNRYSPFPEEINRQITSRIATWHFAPTRSNRSNLLAEGIPEGDIVITGNTGIDALLTVRERIYATEQAKQRCRAQIESVGYPMGGRPFILVTGHRRESFGLAFKNICQALATLARELPDHDIVYPVHLNPNVQGPVRQSLSNIPNVYLTAPIDYEPFVFLMNESHLVLTDSGGLQEEAPSLGKPVLVMRENTERPEAIEAGTAMLVGTNPGIIVATALELVRNPVRYRTMAQAVNPYGDGTASAKIATTLSRLGLH